MPEFDIFPENLKKDSVNLGDLSKKIKDAQQKVLDVSRRLSFSSASSVALKKQLVTVAEELGKESQKMSKMCDSLGDISDAYDRHERLILWACEDGKIGPVEGIIGHMQYADAAREVSFLEVDELKHKFKDIKEKKKKNWKKGYYDKDGWHDDPEDDKKKTTKEKVKDAINDVNIITAGASAETYLWGIKDEDGNLTYDVKALDAEAHAKVSAGIYGYDADGNRVFRPGVGFDVGTSVTAFSATGTALLGSEMLGAYVSGEVTVGKAEAKAEGKIGFVDGKINANVDLSAEAIALEAKAQVGAKVAGTDVSGNIGVNVGVGAHANVGIEGGKIKLDIGASLGVGVSANLEIDVSGTVDMLKDCGAKVGKAISKLKFW